MCVEVLRNERVPGSIIAGDLRREVFAALVREVRDTKRDGSTCAREQPVHMAEVRGEMRRPSNAEAAGPSR